jgi:prepilin signal peptidase PulO-like enzyme (type II secretory pathway)
MNIGVIHKAESLTVFLICFAPAAVDFTVKKIPNMLVLALIICKTVFLGLNYSSDELIKSIIGFAVACVVFLLPSLFGLSVGAGDIKFAAVTGLYLGITGFLQAMIIMAVLIAVYGFYIIITKKGSFKSKTSMGPYLALGMFCSLLYPVF